jgi:hypothetical protein
MNVSFFGSFGGIARAQLRTMLHRITAIWLLCTGLIFAGVPALACCDASAPPDCCRQGQQAPAQDNHISTLAFAPVETCCAAGATQTTTIAASTATPDVRKHSPHPDPLPLIAAFVLWAADGSAPSAKVGRPAAIYLPSYSTLYLSSGRLRL